MNERKTEIYTNFTTLCVAVAITLLPDVGSRNDPYRGGKRQLSEGGIRTTMFVSWPGVIASGRTLSVPVTAIALTPTILAAAERPEAADASIEGINLLPLLRGTQSGLAPRALCWRFGWQFAVREGDWKLSLSGTRRCVSATPSRGTAKT